MERGWRQNLTLFAMLAWVEIPWDRAVTAAMVSFLWSSSHKKHLLHVLRWVRLSKIGVEEALSRSYRRSRRERDRPCSRFLFKVFQKRASVSLSSQSQRSRLGLVPRGHRPSPRPGRTWWPARGEPQQRGQRVAYSPPSFSLAVLLGDCTTATRARPAPLSLLRNGEDTKSSFAAKVGVGGGVLA